MKMTISRLRSQLWLPATLVLLICVMTASAPAEDPDHPKPSGLGSTSMQQPFNLFFGCPPAACIGSWNGDDGPASAITDFTPAGVPVAFNFTTGAPITWQCSQEYEYCEATYGVGGSITVTGVLGQFTGEITSGSAYVDSQSVQIRVNFTGHWGNGQPMHGGARYIYEEANGIPNTELNMALGQ
jgi:hypothetical protein